MMPLENAVLPPGIRSRFVSDINGLRIHMLEAGFDVQERPCVLLLHGFPELAYSWRKVMLPLAAAGFRVVAPDLRGYGRTTGWDADYDGDLGPSNGTGQGRGGSYFFYFGSQGSFIVRYNNSEWPNLPKFPTAAVGNSARRARWMSLMVGDDSPIRPEIS